MDFAAHGSTFTGFMPVQVEPQIIFFTPSIICYSVVLYLTIKNEERKITTLFFITFFIKLITGYILAHYFIPDDGRAFYSNFMHQLKYGDALLWHKNLYWRINQVNYMVFGANIFNIIVMNSFFSTWGAYLSYKTIKLFRNNVSKPMTYFVAFLPIWLYLGVSTEKECLISLILVSVLYFLKKYEFSTIKIFLTTNILMLISAQLRFAIFFACLAFSNLWFAASAIHERFFKINKLLIITVLILSSSVLLYSYKKQAILDKAIQGLHIVTFEQKKIASNSYFLSYKDAGNGSIKENSSGFILFSQKYFNYGVHIYFLNILRTFYSPSPLKPIRDLIFKKDIITVTNFFDHVFNASIWYFFFPVVLIGFIRNTQSSFWVLSFFYLMINHIVAAFPDIIGNPQFIRYRLPGLVLVALLGLIYLPTFMERPKKLLEKIILYSWISSCVAFQLVYFYFS